MKKKLDIDGITNELEGASLFFSKQRSPLPAEESEKQQSEKVANPLADSPFFESAPAPQPPQSSARENDAQSIKKSGVRKQTHEKKTSQARASSNLHNKKQSDNVSNSASNPLSMHASTLASTQDDIVETIRKTVKQVGKDTLFVRLTPGEKHQVASAVYALNEMYRGESRKTSENEIGRIGVNFILEDYKANGKESILAKVLAALNA